MVEGINMSEDYYINSFQAMFESFVRAFIRFWDNRFHPRDNPIELYREEVFELRRRNRELTELVFTTLASSTREDLEPETETSNDELINLGKPIETSLQKRKRLEHQSLTGWNRMVQEAQEELKKKSVEIKPTEELEKDVLGVIN